MFFEKLKNQKNDGFTLVELIVVIAILAILAGIGVPAYSGYVEKANISVDETLIAEVKQALTLAYYDGTLKNSGHVILSSTSNVNSSSEEVTVALKAVFGEDLSGLKLKHDGWVPEMLNAVSGGNTASVAGSTYAQDGADELLSEVQKCTTYLTDFINEFTADPTMGYNALAFFFEDAEGHNAFSDMIKDAGLKDGNTYTGSQEALSNATVFALANYMGNASNNVASKFVIDSSSEEAAMGYMMFTPISDQVYDENGSMKLDALYTVATNYAALKGMATYLGEDAQKSFDNINLDGSVEEILASLDKAQTDIFTNNVEALSGYFAEDPTTGKSQAQMDGEAFVSIMGTVDSLSSDYTNAEDLSNANLMTDGSVNNRVTNYIAGATSGISVSNGVVVYANVTNNGFSCSADAGTTK